MFSFCLTHLHCLVYKLAAPPKIHMFQYSSEESEDDLDDTMAKLNKKKKVFIYGARQYKL